MTVKEGLFERENRPEKQKEKRRRKIQETKDRKEQRQNLVRASE